jgi:hypothetical protein
VLELAKLQEVGESEVCVATGNLDVDYRDLCNLRFFVSGSLSTGYCLHAIVYLCTHYTNAHTYVLVDDVMMLRSARGS